MPKQRKNKDYYALILREIKKGRTVFVDVEDVSVWQYWNRYRIVTPETSIFSFDVGSKDFMQTSCFVSKKKMVLEQLIEKMKAFDIEEQLEIKAAVVLDTGKYL